MPERSVPMTVLLAVSAMFFWGLQPAAIKLALSYLPVMHFIFYRYLLASLLLLFATPSLIRKVRQVNCLNYIYLFVLTATLYFTQGYALFNTPASWYAISAAIAPVLYVLLQRHQLPLVAWLGCAVAIMGLVFFLWKGEDIGHGSIIGILELLASIVSWVLYTILLKRFQKVFTDIEIVQLTSLLGLFAALVGILVLHEGEAVINIHVLGAVGSVTVISVLAMVLFTMAVRARPVLTMFIEYLEPVFGVLFAHFILSECMHFSQYVSAAVILLGTAVVSYATREMH